MRGRESMKRGYVVIYGGEEWILAESDEEAYRKFREVIQCRLDERKIGLIGETYELPPVEDQEEIACQDGPMQA
jgi:hypothetical protein